MKDKSKLLMVNSITESLMKTSAKLRRMWTYEDDALRSLVIDS